MAAVYGAPSKHDATEYDKLNDPRAVARVRYSPMTTFLLFLFAETGETVDRKVLS